MPNEPPTSFIGPNDWQVLLVVVLSAFLSSIIRVRASGHRVSWRRNVDRALAASVTALAGYGFISFLGARPGFLATCSISLCLGWVGSSLMKPLNRIALERYGITLPDEGGEEKQEVRQG